MLRRGARVALVALLAGCAAAPYTRRSQLILISSEEENKLGARAFQQVLGKSHVDGRAQVNGPVEAAGQRLARVAERPDYKWRFVAIDDPKQQNAFCLPGGKVAVYTGIFPIAESTNGLAVVLGHEIAHALARHGAERISQGLVTQAGGSLLGARSEEHTSELQSPYDLVCRLLLEKTKRCCRDRLRRFAARGRDAAATLEREAAHRGYG